MKRVLVVFLILIMVFTVVNLAQRTQIEIGQGYQYGFAMSDTSQAFDSYSFLGMVYRPVFSLWDDFQWRLGYMYRFSPTKFQTLSGEHLNTLLGGIQFVNKIGETNMTVKTGTSIGWTIPSIDYFYNSAFTFMVDSKVYFELNCCSTVYAGVGFIRDSFRNNEVLLSLTPMIGIMVRK